MPTFVMVQVMFRVFVFDGFTLVVTVSAAVVVVVVVVAVLGLPGHFVLFFESAAGVGEPGRHLRQRHLGDDGQHDLLAFGRVRVLLVLRQPGLEGGRRFPRRILPPRRQIVTGAVTAEIPNKFIKIPMQMKCK